MSLRLVKAEQDDYQVTVWLIGFGQHIVLSMVLVVLWLSLPAHHLLPMWTEVVGVALAMVAPSTFTRIRLTSVEPKTAYVTTLWLGLVPVRSRRQVAQVIVAEHSATSTADDVPDQVTFNLSLDDAWSLDCVSAEEIADLLNKWQARMKKRLR